MKVKLERNYKRYYTVEEYEQAKVVIAAEKEDETKVTDYAEMAVREFCRVYHLTDSSILSVDTTTGKNRRAYNAYTDSAGNESGCMDVFLDIYAEIYMEADDGLFKRAILNLSAMLSDIWQIDGETDIARHMWGEIFFKSKTIREKY